jgi:hypothetical protein
MRDSLVLTSQQIQIIESGKDQKVFLSGIAGTGKTTVGINRLLYLIDLGVPQNTILLFFPQRTLCTPYLNALSTPGLPPGGSVSYLTLSGLARRMIELFWPLIAEDAGFAQPRSQPIFLTLETAQYYMTRLVTPLMEQGYFSSVTIERNRLLSQIIDNLNKSAIVGFPHTQIADLLKSAWSGDRSQYRVYDDAQSCANLFREYCFNYNLLDFSLQVEIFKKFLWTNQLCRQYILNSYQHIIVDNIEEDTPVSHDILRDWLPHASSALLIQDQEAGFRRFLGADPESAQSLAESCDEVLTFDENIVMSDETSTLCLSLGKSLRRKRGTINLIAGRKVSDSETPTSLNFHNEKYFPEMLDWVASTIANMVQNEGVFPGNIAILSPFLSDSLRFSLSSRLDLFGIPNHSHRPSRSIHAEPLTHSLMTLAILGHPEWMAFAPSLKINKFDLAYTLVQAIEGMDLVRAQILVDIVFHYREGIPVLTSFDRINATMQERISYHLGENYERLRLWIENYRQSEPAELDHYLSRLFGEVLSQPNFGFHSNILAGEVTANMIESIQKFRWAIDGIDNSKNISLGVEYLEMVRSGVLAAQYVRSWEIQRTESVLLAPAYTFLMSNQPVDFQFWIDVGNNSWSERLYQPLTHPYVLCRHWPKGKIWTDTNEMEANQEALYRLAIGLLRRCRKGIFLGLSEFNEQGFEQRGVFLLAFQRVLRELHV